MCGWTGFWNQDGAGDECELVARVSRMTATLIHRGPDDVGTWCEPGCGLALGFRRLAILDLSPKGHQPMRSRSGRYVVVFNGEIYNFLAIRGELEAQGYTFRGDSDTEVMLAAVEQLGVDAAMGRFVGMFAFALWDREERCLVLGRDRLGKKPLYYGYMGRTLLFGSELKALRAHPCFRAEVDRSALTLLLRYGAVSAPYSIYRGIRQLPPGCLTRISERDQCLQSPEAYWSMKDVAERGAHEPFEGTDGEAVDRLEELLCEAVGLRMIADVPLGAFLSGGVDSSTVVALMQAQSTRQVRTFSIGFLEESYDEARYAKAVAAYLKTQHTELHVTAEEAMAVIPRLPEIYDEPFGDSSQIPTLLLSELTRQSVTVGLSGDGGDELFGGYERYFRAQAIWQKLGWIPRGVRRMLARGLRMADAMHLLASHTGRLSGVLGVPSPEAVYQYVLSHWKDPAAVVLDGYEPTMVFSDHSRWPARSSFTERMFFFDSVSYLPDDILTKVDRASMAVSLEARVPLLDHRVVEFAWSLPLSMKHRNGNGKWILRQVLYRYVPQRLVDRPKMGFGLPLGTWLRGHLREWAEELLDEHRLRQEGYFRPEPIREMWREHLSGRRNREYHLWDVLMFQAWLERWGGGARLPQADEQPASIDNHQAGLSTANDVRAGATQA